MKDKQLLLMIRIISGYESITFKILDILRSNFESEVRNELYDYGKEILELILKEPFTTTYEKSVWVENAYSYLNEEKTFSNSKWFSGDLYLAILFDNKLTSEDKLSNIRKLKKFNDNSLSKVSVI